MPPTYIASVSGNPRREQSAHNPWVAGSSLARLTDKAAAGADNPSLGHMS
jgi:hypothetical protein